jgi:hypothetical protein
MFATGVLLGCDSEMEIASIRDSYQRRLRISLDWFELFLLEVCGEAATLQFSSEIHFGLSFTSFALNNRASYCSPS